MFETFRKAWKIDDLNDQDKIMSLKIADVIGVDENSPAVLQAMRDRTLADLNDKDTFNQLALGEVIEIDESNPDTPALLVSLQQGALAAVLLENQLVTLRSPLPKVFREGNGGAVAKGGLKRENARQQDGDRAVPLSGRAVSRGIGVVGSAMAHVLAPPKTSRAPMAGPEKRLFSNS